MAMVEAAGNQVVARAFGRRLGEDGSLHFPESAPVHVAAYRHGDPVTQSKIFLQLMAAEVEIPVFEPQVFGCSEVVFDGERRRPGFAQNRQFFGRYF